MTINERDWDEIAAKPNEKHLLIRRVGFDMSIMTRLRSNGNRSCDLTSDRWTIFHIHTELLVKDGQECVQRKLLLQKSPMCKIKSSFISSTRGKFQERKGCTIPGGTAIAGRCVEWTEQALTLPAPKINVIYGPEVGYVSDIKLIRTDTLLDRSQKP